MSEHQPQPPSALDQVQADDVKTDRDAFLMGAALLLAAVVVNATSSVADNDRNQVAIKIWFPWLFEGSSVFVIILLIPLLAWFSRRVPLRFDNWPRTVLIYLAASVVLSLIHVGAMVAIRKIAFTLFADGSYIFAGETRSLLQELIYEYRKDIFTFGLLFWLISLNRNLAESRRETAAAREDARNQHRLTLKCGGRTLFVDAPTFLSAKAAGNYVEIKTRTHAHLARMTLATLLDQLSNAGVAVARCHRSHIVNTEAISQISPGKDGNASLLMENGDEIPVSKNFKDQLTTVINR